MAFNDKEQEIIKWGLQNGKSQEEVTQALTNFRTGVIPENKIETQTEPTYLESLKQDLDTRVDRVTDIQNRQDSSTLEKGVQIFGQGAGLAANAIEKTAEQIPGAKKVFELAGKGIEWLTKTSPIKFLGEKLGENELFGKIVTLYDTDPNFKDTLDGITNAVRLGADVQMVADGLNFTKNVAEKITSGVKDLNIPEKIGSITDKTVSGLKSVAEGRDTKMLSIFSGESTDVVNKAIANPSVADLGIKEGDIALRNAIKTGAESSIKAKQTFTKAYSTAFKNLVKDNPGKLLKYAKQNISTKFSEFLENSNVKLSKGKLDFTKSKIIANPGEVGKIKDAYKAIQSWTDFSFEGVNELKQLVGQLTKFATEAGGSSKSPLLGQFYHYLDTVISDNLPKDARLIYETMNKKFSDTIGLYDNMVKAFNSGDPFTRLSQLFGQNKDTLRQVIDFYETTTGNQISPIVAGRTLAMEKQAAFGFLNPRSWVDFFIPPKLQAKIVTGYGKLKGSKAIKGVDDVIDTGKKAVGEIPETNLIQEAKKYKSAEEFVKKVQNESNISQQGKLQQIPLNKITGSDYAELDTALKNGKLSLTDAQNILPDNEIDMANSKVSMPIEVIKNKDGTYSLQAGNHRVAQQLVNGEKTIFANIQNEKGFSTKSQLTDIWNKANKK
jgi:hypothetical protein